MEADWDELFTVDEIMGGLPARRASMVLFAIEGRTGQIVGRSRRAMSRDFSGRSAEQEEQAFLSALFTGPRCRSSHRSRISNGMRRTGGPLFPKNQRTGSACEAIR